MEEPTRWSIRGGRSDGLDILWRSTCYFWPARNIHFSGGMVEVPFWYTTGIGQVPSISPTRMLLRAIYVDTVASWRSYTNI
jgi:hypothetical protein